MAGQYPPGMLAGHRKCGWGSAKGVRPEWGWGWGYHMGLWGGWSCILLGAYAWRSMREERWGGAGGYGWWGWSCMEAYAGGAGVVVMQGIIIGECRAGGLSRDPSGGS